MTAPKSVYHQAIVYRKRLNKLRRPCIIKGCRLLTANKAGICTKCLKVM